MRNGTAGKALRAIVPPIAALAITASAALAQTGLAPQALPPPPLPGGEWRVSIAAGTMLTPDYPGSSGYRLAPLVGPDISWRDDTLFLSVRDGLGATLLRSGGLSLGPVLRLRFGRDQDDNDALRGMGDIRPSGEGGLFLRYADEAWRGLLELRQGFGGHSSLVADARLDRVLRLRHDLVLSAGPRLSWGGEDFADTYFGVSAGQAQRSGYARFSARDYWGVGVAASATWLFAERWSATAFGELGRILGDAADSPLVDRRGDPTQGVIGLALAYRFLP